MKYFDAHTHVNFAAYDADRAEVIRRSLEDGVGMNVVGTKFETSSAAVALAETQLGLYATIGLHPVHTTASYHDAQELGGEGSGFTSKGEQFDISNYERLGRSEKVIAIGECGLDYYRIDPATKAKQVEAFLAQIELANTLRKPLMLHVRPSKGSMDAYRDALEIVASQAKTGGDVHFFAGDWDIAQRFLALGFTLSFTGVITFARDYDDVVRDAPLDMLLSETDAPYVTPVPHRGTRNEPLYVQEVVRAIARVRGMAEEAVATQLMANAERVFGITL